jgi:hypothetical protein
VYKRLSVPKNHTIKIMKGVTQLDALHIEGVTERHRQTLGASSRYPPPPNHSINARCPLTKKTSCFKNYRKGLYCVLSEALCRSVFGGRFSVLPLERGLLGISAVFE